MCVDLVVCRTDSALKFGWFFFTYLVSFPFGFSELFLMALTHQKVEVSKSLKYDCSFT